MFTEHEGGTKQNNCKYKIQQNYGNVDLLSQV